MSESGEQIDEFVLQDGESDSFYVFDERELSVKEQTKE